jgi:hypothetical protein
LAKRTIAHHTAKTNRVFNIADQPDQDPITDNANLTFLIKFNNSRWATSTKRKKESKKEETKKKTMSTGKMRPIETWTNKTFRSGFFNCKWNDLTKEGEFYSQP